MAGMTSKPVALILAGPNGAGKTTVDVGPDVEFVNADIIGAELRRDDPDRAGADVTAGRIVSARLRSLTAERRSFCFETNLASPGLVGKIDAWRADGYEVKLTFISLANVEIALTRVAARVAGGGHDIPDETVRRRFSAGLRYFFTLYQFRVDERALYDNDDGGPVLIASGRRGGVSEIVHKPVAFAGLLAMGGVPTGSKDGTGDVSQAQVTDIVDLDDDMVARHLEWQRAMQEAVAQALDEHRAKGHSIAVRREAKVVTLAPSQY